MFASDAMLVDTGGLWGGLHGILCQPFAWHVNYNEKACIINCVQDGQKRKSCRRVATKTFTVVY